MPVACPCSGRVFQFLVAEVNGPPIPSQAHGRSAFEWFKQAICFQIFIGAIGHVDQACLLAEPQDRFVALAPMVACVCIADGVAIECNRESSASSRLLFFIS
jgi:hypothetical protein